MMAEGLKALLSDEFELTGIVEDGRAMAVTRKDGSGETDGCGSGLGPERQRYLAQKAAKRGR